MLHPDFHAQLRPWLLPGERLLWAGRPKQGLLLRAADFYLVPYGLFFLGFALLWNQTVWSGSGAPLPFAIVGTFILFSGVYFALGRFLADALVRAKLLYAVTDRRVVILRHGPWPRVRALELSHLPMLELDQRAGGRGTINFDVAPEPGFWSNQHRPDFTPSLSKIPRFLVIEDAAAVYDLISREAERQRRERMASLPSDRAAFIG